MTMNQPKPLRVLVKLKNNRLLELRESRGMSAKAVAEASGISYNLYIAYECLNVRAKKWVQKKREEDVFEWKVSALKLATFWGELPEDIFPAITQTVRKTSSHFKASEHEIKHYLVGSRNSMPLLPEDVPERVTFTREIMPMVLEGIQEYIEKGTTFDTSEDKRTRNAEMFLRYYGLCGREKNTLLELQNGFGITKGRVQQLIGVVTNAIRKNLRVQLKASDNAEWREGNLAI